MNVEVAFPLAVRQEFTYSVPPLLQKEILPGVQVLAPLGKRNTAGIVTRILTKTTRETKPIVQVSSLGQIISPQLLELTRWVSRYYFCSWGEALRAALPKNINLKSEELVQLHSDNESPRGKLSSEELKVVDYLEAKNGAKVNSSTLRRKLGPPVNQIVKQLERKGWVELSFSAETKERKQRREKSISLCKAEIPEDLKENERPLWNYLAERGMVTLKELKKTIKRPEGALLRLEQRGWVKIQEKEAEEDYWDGYEVSEMEALELTFEQSQALAQIEPCLGRKQFTPFLLFGVTGSGKTEVYLRAAQKTLERGGSVLVLVPEISLTVQTILRFKAKFRDRVIQLHSGMTDKERLEAWRRIKSGKYHVVIGVRSAIFAPLENLGLIIVDEEHDSSYKQSEPAPRYSARDLSLVRGKLEQGVVILGSATPSIESYYNAQNGKYALLTLSERVQKKPMPRVEVIDLKAERKAGNYGFLTGRLKDEIERGLKEKQQVILFLNRRGFSSLIKCQDCGYVPVCRNCNVTLTFHLQGFWLRCHFCGYQKKAPPSCPACNSLKFLYKGAGTQRIEEEIKKMFGEDSVRRLDSDLSSKRNYTLNLLADFQAGKFPILLGTQMVTKGYDFPEVTLVGVISADVSLELPDFRASEKTFQLLTQVAGRSGRGEKPGEVIVQSYHPQEGAIQLAALQDYEEFYRHELAIRRQLDYPPFCHLILILVSGANTEKVQKHSAQLKESLAQQSEKGKFSIMGPAPAPLERVRGRYRYRLMLKTNQVFQSVKQIEKVLAEGKIVSGREIRITVEVDPVDLL
jgi:primosomal protein N' (replication factor Y)